MRENYINFRKAGLLILWLLTIVLACATGYNIRDIEVYKERAAERAQQEIEQEPLIISGSLIVEV